MDSNPQPNPQTLRDDGREMRQMWFLGWKIEFQLFIVDFGLSRPLSNNPIFNTLLKNLDDSPFERT
jgi:hypothetical protein